MGKKRRRPASRWMPLVWLGVLIGLWLLFTPWIWRTIYPFPHKETIYYYARAYNLDPQLVAAVVRVESGFNPKATSPRGAVGLMQVMPETARWVSRQAGLPFEPKQLYDPVYNIQVGTWYLAYLHQEFDGNLAMVLAAYNGGSAKVKEWVATQRWDGSLRNIDRIPFAETRDFVRKVLRDYQFYRWIYV